MTKRYSSEKDILDLVERFEAGAIERADWKHAEHLTVALFYISRNDLDTAMAKMRTGIFNLLRAFRLDLSKEMPYHETLTVFWMRTISDFNAAEAEFSLPDKANELVVRFDKQKPKRNNTREIKKTDKARETFVNGDLIDQC
jgi:hypothetical protein